MICCYHWPEEEVWTRIIYAEQWSVTWFWWNSYSAFKDYSQSCLLQSSHQLSQSFQCDSQASSRSSSRSTGHLLEIQKPRPRLDTPNQKLCGQRHRNPHAHRSLRSGALGGKRIRKERAHMQPGEALFFCYRDVGKSIPHMLKTKAANRKRPRC